ncbi:MAG: tetratricopeptide repeat protein [Polyangiales bacterium]
MVRSFWLAAAALLGTAPYQCKSNDPERAREETVGEALWQLCGRFADKGDDESAKRVLDYLIERYPSSREAERAKDERTAAHPCKGVTAEAAKKPASSSSK